MSLEKKIDFVCLVSVTNANPNGDPMIDGRPRCTSDDFGEISDVCIKRKIRNRMQDLGHDIFVQTEGRVVDGYKSLADRAKALGIDGDDEAFLKKACDKYLDIRAFGQLFTIKKEKDCEGITSGVRGPVSIQIANSVDPVEIETMQITKYASFVTSEKKGPDTMGKKQFVRFGLYIIKGSINVQPAEKTGFSEEDAEVIKECLRTLFVNDACATRPDGSMVVNRLYWFTHNTKEGQYPAYEVHNSVHVKLKEGVMTPKSFDDYVVTREELEGLKCEGIKGW